MSDQFKKFRDQIIGADEYFESPFKERLKIIYADWTASGRMYGPLEQHLIHHIYPYVANTHTETNTTGKAMTSAYHKALQIIKKHVNANANDIIISSYSGMTGVVNKLQRILGLKIHEHYADKITIAPENKPVVFITHMEHHSNQTSWLETIAEVVIIQPDEAGLVDLNHFAQLLKLYANRPLKIAAITSCSNVTGIFTPYFKMAEMIHEVGGFCFVDFACSAPYIEINMHPENKNQQLDAIYFSPHKFLGGPGSAGVLIFNRTLYTNKIPDISGGGTVEWTNPWGEHKYFDNIETREDGGTPSFIQTIRTALCIKLKEEIGVQKMMDREKEMMNHIWEPLNAIPNFHILEAHNKNRLCIISFYIDDLHYNLGVKMLNDRFGIQVRGGCSCAGTYGHYILNVQREYSNHITDLINHGDYSEKPGWIRLSIHPTTSDQDIDYILEALKQLAKNHKSWAKDYHLDLRNNDIQCNKEFEDNWVDKQVNSWFDYPMAISN